MSNLDIIRAWKDKEYRNSLGTVELAMLPENPAGMIELTDAELGFIVGGAACTSSNTSTGGQGCRCDITATANSGAGECKCHCDKSFIDAVDVVEAVIVGA
jgi:mersacidin/lichenicidin family type 2 lantibiotic